MRRSLAMLAAVLTGLVGAVVLGEYSITGIVGLAAGVVFGLLVGEVALGVAGTGSAALAVVCATAAFAGVAGGGWIAAGNDLGRIPAAAWGAVGLAAVAAGIRARPPRRAPRTTPAPSPEQ